MALTDNELLTAVKVGLGMSGSALDSRLLMHLKAVKNLMINYDITTAELESDLGVQAIALGVQDLMNGNPGEVKFSTATEMAIGQLHHICLPEIEEEEGVGMFKPNASTFVTPIRIKHRTETLINGAPKFAWADATDPIALCNWKGRGGTESVSAGVLTVLDTAELTMWYRSDIAETDKLLKNDDATQEYEVTNVENVEERNIYLIVKVRRVKAT